MSVTANIQAEKYKTIVQTSTNQIIVDEPLALGGQDLGFNPAELLESSLATCTVITLRMYCDHKGWDVKELTASVELKDEKENPNFERNVVVKGKLDEQQIARLLSVANACPMHKVLSRGLQTTTEISYQEV